ncbi:PseG/SpsG family protein [Pseudomonadota bacterium]
MKQSNPIVLRVDGSSEIGMGHVMRCLGLADALTVRNLEVLFVASDSSDGAQKVISEYGFKFVKAKDERGVISLLKSYQIELMVTDLSNTRMVKDKLKYASMLQRYKNTGVKLVVFDGLVDDCICATQNFDVDVVVIPYYGATDLDLKCNPDVELLGSDYFVFRREFLIKKIPTKKFGPVRRLLVSLGGGDTVGITTKVIDAIKDDVKGMEVVVTLGVDGIQAIENQLAKMLSQTKMCRVVTKSVTMARDLKWSDLVIMSSGLTRYEAALMGVPGMVISYDELQAQAVEKFIELNTIKHLGLQSDITRSEISSAFVKMCANRKWREKMSENGQRLVDGKGVDRIVDEILKLI